MKNKDYTKDICNSLQILSKNYGHHPLGAHLTMATEGSNLEYLTDKEVADALEVHIARQDLDQQTQIINYQDDLMSDLDDEEDLY